MRIYQVHDFEVLTQTQRRQTTSESDSLPTRSVRVKKTPNQWLHSNRLLFFLLVFRST